MRCALIQFRKVSKLPCWRGQNADLLNNEKFVKENKVEKHNAGGETSFHS